MRLTIIPSDEAVYKDNLFYAGLVWESTPDNIHALQWNGSKGWIEFNDGSSNLEINELPIWANNAIIAFDVKHSEILNYVAPEPTYADKRQAEYPPIADYLDGVVKGDQAQIDKYIADCRAVKAKYPKS